MYVWTYTHTHAHTHTHTHTSICVQAPVKTRGICFSWSWIFRLSDMGNWVGPRTVNPLNGWTITPSLAFPTNLLLLAVFWAKKYFSFLGSKSNYVRSANGTTIKEYSSGLHQFSLPATPAFPWPSFFTCAWVEHSLHFALWDGSLTVLAFPIVDAASIQGSCWQLCSLADTD